METWVGVLRYLDLNGQAKVWNSSANTELAVQKDAAEFILDNIHIFALHTEAAQRSLGTHDVLERLGRKFQDGEYNYVMGAAIGMILGGFTTFDGVFNVCESSKVPSKGKTKGKTK